MSGAYFTSVGLHVDPVIVVSHRCCYCDALIRFKVSKTMRGRVGRMPLLLARWALPPDQTKGNTAVGTWDHVEPAHQRHHRVRRFEQPNLVEACYDCNQSKGSRGLVQWLLSRRTAHPQ